MISDLSEKDLERRDTSGAGGGRDVDDRGVTRKDAGDERSSGAWGFADQSGLEGVPAVSEHGGADGLGRHHCG